MQKSRLIIAASPVVAATLILAACDGGKKDQAEHGTISNAPIAENEDRDAGADRETVPATPGNATKPPSPSDGVIPLALRGRWGLVAKDCGPDAGIAKGLMTIDGKQLRFYESVGKPVTVNTPTPSRMEGRFSFSGEGMEWSKDMVLTIEGSKLVRTEKDPTASYSYSRCPD